MESIRDPVAALRLPPATEDQAFSLMVVRVCIASG